MYAIAWTHSLAEIPSQIKTHGSESRGQEKPPTWPRKTAHPTTTESPLHVQPLLKTEQQNSPFYAFENFTAVLN